MDYIKKYLKYYEAITKRRPYLKHVLIILSFVALTAYYMSPSVLHCNSVVHGFGDSTSGPIWRAQVSPQSPLWGYEKQSNYPFGDNLYSPVHFSGALQYTYFWAVAKITGPICAYNVVNFVGFISAASVMYGFIFYMTKRRAIAWLAGYVVSFTPYFQIKVGGHPSYGYHALLIGAFWATVHLFKSPTKKAAAVLATLLTVCFYFDPYFSLLVITILLPTVGIWLLLGAHASYKKHSFTKAFRAQFISLLFAGTMTIIALLPLAYIRIANADRINQAVIGSRSNLLETARVCSNYPHEYLLPFALHPLILKTLTSPEEVTLRKNVYSFSTCGIAEDAVGLSLIVVTIATLGLVIGSWELLNKRKIALANNLRYDPKLLLLSTLAVALTATLIALPPAKFLFIPTPSYTIIKLVDIWRILAREYVVLNIAVTVIFALSLAFFADTFKRHLHRNALYAGFAIIFFVVFVEYQAFAPFKGNTHSGFDYRKAPTAYYWLKDQPIKSIAEYPNEHLGTEADTSVYYQSMQSIHKKPLFNTALSDSPQNLLHASLKDLSDPQTVPALASLGIEAVVIHGVDKEAVAQIPYLQIIYAGNHQPDLRVPPTPRVSTQELIIAKIVDAPKVSAVFEFTKQPPFNHTLVSSAVDWQYEVTSGSSLQLTDLMSGQPSGTTEDLCFKLRSVDTAIQNKVDIYDKDDLRASYTVSKEPVTIRLRNVSEARFITAQKQPLVLSELGCAQ